MIRALTCAALVLGLAACTSDSNLGSRDVGSAGRGGSPQAGTQAASGAGNAGAGGAGTGSAGASGAAGTFMFDAETIRWSACYRSRAATEIPPSNVLFVIDRSGSMACNPPPITDSQTCEADQKPASPDQPSKWAIMQRAIVEFLKILPETARVGLSYFSNDDQCGVYPTPSVLLALNSAAQSATIGDSLAAEKPAGSTPLVGATILAYRYLHEQALAGNIPGNKYVVLLTDGKQSETCSDARCGDAESCTRLLIEQEVPKAASPGVQIRTFVIGVPGSEMDRRTLSRIAVAGHTERPGCDPELGNCHFDVTKVGAGDFGPDLGLALANILGQTLACDMPTPADAVGSLNENEVNVLFSTGSAKEIVPQDNTKPCDGPDGAEGWQAAENGTRIRVCGKYCELARSNPNSSLELVIGCPVVGPQ